MLAWPCSPLPTVDFVLSAPGGVAGDWLAVRLDDLGPRLIADIGYRVAAGPASR